MSFVLPSLPYSPSDLSPHISKTTVEFHYGKHHRGYVNKLNAIAETDSNVANSSLETLILNEKGKIFNLAAQIWNHTFYWNSLSPNGGGKPSGKVLELINRDFGSVDNFKKQFNEVAVSHFGSGWAWLVLDSNSKLQIIGTHDAGNPLTDNLKPLLTCDVWEHAYYIDYKNARGEYLNAFWNIVNWNHVQTQL